METINVPIKEVIHVHSGQYHAYGDSFSVWDIILEEGAELTPDEILPYCFAELSKRKVQSKSEWSARHSDAGSYFSGYYELTKIPQGYKYTVCSPYTD